MHKILTVDDEQVPRDFISFVVAEQELPVTVFHADSAKNALAICTKELPELVLLDIEMPGRDGLSLAETIRHRYPWVPIVFLTAHDDFPFAQQALRLGAQDYLLKPLTPDACVAVIKRWVIDRDANRFGPSDTSDSISRFNELTTREERLSEAVRIVKNKPQGAPSMPELAERLGFSKSHFSRLFHQFTGHTYSRFVQHARIERAKILLSTTDYTLSRIAVEVGYDDPSYLSSLFSTLTGERPSDYRKKNS